MLRFKGCRRYLHGTDIFDAVLAQGGITPPLSMQLRSVIRHQIALCDPGIPPADGKIVGAFRHASGTMALVEQPLRPVTASYPYDEEAVCGDAAAKDGWIDRQIPSTHSFIETAVALHKRLLRAELPEVSEWWFVQIGLERDPRGTRHVALRARQPLVHRLAVSEVWIDGRLAGTIGFSARH